MEAIKSELHFSHLCIHKPYQRHAECKIIEARTVIAYFA